MSASTRELVRQFNVAFNRPVNSQWTELTADERILFAKLLYEEVTEYITKGLGLMLTSNAGNMDADSDDMRVMFTAENPVNNLEIVDGLADVNAVIHFCAHWHGFNLDRATEVVNDSNMSKLGEDGKPIINGVTEGYEVPHISGSEHLSKFDPSKPIGKILKGPNFYEPQPWLVEVIMEGNHE